MIKDDLKQILYKEIQRLYIEYKETKDNIFDIFYISTKYNLLFKLLKDNSVKSKEWTGLVREVLFFEDNDLRYMYNRIMQIVRRFKELMGQYFEINNQSGTYLAPDRLSELNRFFELYENFFYSIYPKIFNQLNVNSFTIERDSAVLSGKVNWNKTVLKNFLGDENKVPLQFTVVSTESTLQNPENILFLSYLLRIGIDAKTLKGYGFKDPLNSDEFLILNNIVDGCNQLVDSTNILYPLLQKGLEYANLSIYDRQLVNLENIVKEKISNGIIIQNGYKLLVDWIEKYRNLNIRIISPNHSNFSIEKIEDLDTMFELWILFEFLDFLDLHLYAKVTKIPTLSQPFKNQLHFKIQYQNYEFDLCYQKKYCGWIRESEPDYTIEANEKIIAIMDAKNWSNRKDEAIYKMLGYLNNLDGDLGVLFFPNSIDVDKFEYKGLNLKNHLDQRIINCVMSLSSKDKTNSKTIELKKLIDVILLYLDKNNNQILTN